VGIGSGQVVGVAGTGVVVVVVVVVVDVVGDLGGRVPVVPSVVACVDSCVQVCCSDHRGYPSQGVLEVVLAVPACSWLRCHRRLDISRCRAQPGSVGLTKCVWASWARVAFARFGDVL